METIQKTGPLAHKLIRAMQKTRQQKVVDMKAWKLARAYQNTLAEANRNEDFSDLNPLHALYAETQHRIAEFIEQFSLLPESRLLNQRFDEAEKLYSPAGPPMSPLTKSYFFYWSTFDMNVGIKRETYAAIVIECCKAFQSEENFLRVIERMQESRMGLYTHEKERDAFVYLRELYTNISSKVFVPSGYQGTPGELWFVRLLSDPFGHEDYSVALTTPYVIIDALATNLNLRSFYAEDKWLAFIHRNLPNVAVKTPEARYRDFMKYGLTKHYWLEYIADGYVNHAENVIWLTGFPDRAETLPHSRRSS